MTETNPRLADRSVFPDPVYKETVLRPLFDGAKTHHVDGFRRIDRAHLVMLVETGILDRDQAGKIAASFQPLAAFAVERAAQARVSRIRHRRSAAFAGRHERIDAHPLHDEIHERELPPDPLGLQPLSLTRPHNDLRLPERPFVPRILSANFLRFDVSRRRARESRGRCLAISWRPRIHSTAALQCCS